MVSSTILVKVTSLLDNVFNFAITFFSKASVIGTAVVTVACSLLLSSSYKRLYCNAICSNRSTRLFCAKVVNKDFTSVPDFEKTFSKTAVFSESLTTGDFSTSFSSGFEAIARAI